METVTELILWGSKITAGGDYSHEIKRRLLLGRKVITKIEARSPTLQADSLSAEPQGKPNNTGVGSLSLLQQIFPTQESTRGSSVLPGQFFTNGKHIYDLLGRK